MAVVVWPLFDTEVLDDSYIYLELIAKTAKGTTNLGLPTLDLFESFQGLDGRRLALVPFTDSHPNELAHRIAADAIHRFLVVNDLVGAETQLPLP